MNIAEDPISTDMESRAKLTYQECNIYYIQDMKLFDGIIHIIGEI